MASLQEFVKNKGVIPGGVATPSASNIKTVPATVSSAGSSLQDFLKNKGTVSASASPTTPTAPVKKVTTAMDTLRWTGKQLMKPTGVIATATEQLGKAIGTGNIKELASIPKKSADIITGKTTRSFSDIWKENLPEHPVAGVIIGTIADIAADPLNFIGGGLTKTGKLAEKVSKLTKAGETVAEGSKLANKIKKAGATATDLKLAATKAEQAAKGQRAFLTIGDKAVLPAKTSEAIYRATGKMGDAIKAIPAVGTAIDKTKSIFSTATKNPAFDALETKMTNLLGYRKANVIEDAKIIQNAIKGMHPDEIIQVSNYLEKGIEPTVPVLKEIGDKLKVTYKNYSDIEKSLGLAENEVINYVPHIKTKEGQKAVELFSPKPWSARLGAAEPRTVLKFVDDSGKGIIGTADSLKLSKVEDIKNGSDIIGSLYKDAVGKQYKVGAGVEQASIEEINKAIGKTLFHENPAVQAAYRGVAHAKAVTSKEFFEGAKEFASDFGVETAIPELKGLKFEPEIAKHLETYYKSINPEKTASVLRIFDAIQNWWKGQALISPAYHIRNSVGNLWNNFLAGVTNPTAYIDAGKIQLGKDVSFVDDIGRHWTSGPVAENVGKKTESIFGKGDKSGQSLLPKQGGSSLFHGTDNIEGILSEGKINPYLERDIRDINRGGTRVGEWSGDPNKAAPVLPQPKNISLSQNPEQSGKFGDILFEFDKNKTPSMKDIREVRTSVVKKGATGADELEFRTPNSLPIKEAKTIYVYEFSKEDAIKTAESFKRAKLSQNVYSSDELVAQLEKAGAKDVRVIRPSTLENPQSIIYSTKTGPINSVSKTTQTLNILEEAKKNGVINQGWYAGDIEKEITGEMGKANLNPFSQNNVIFKGNQKVGSVVENNARLANFIQQLKKGLPAEDAALEVKKYLFDYSDLTWNEKNVLKRAMPFYTFTRKNVPLQLQNLMTQPGKYSGLEKVVQAAENIGMGDNKPANEKYLSDYIKSNTAMRVNYNKDTKSYNYFLLGNWLPAYQAMDFLSKPLPNMMAMLTPIIKTPIETLTNTSSFWRNTMDEYQNIERYPGEQVNYLGFNMPKKTAQVLRNIRLLNDLDKLNPGLIFGGKQGEKSIFAKAKLPAVKVPLAGNISPSQYKYTSTAVKPSSVERGVGFLSSKLVNYKPAYSREFYNQDTDTRVQEYKTAIKRAAKTGDKARVKLLTQQMNEFRKKRGN